jgi:hypothetical protein
MTMLTTDSPIELVVCQDGSVFGWSGLSDDWVLLSTLTAEQRQQIDLTVLGVTND